MVLMIILFVLMLFALWLGSRHGGLALGAICGLALALMVFCFGLKPGTPPIEVMLIIIAAITCAGIMQASGGMDWLIQLAEKVLRKHPNNITFLAPFATFLLTVLCGTGHVVYMLMPIICDIALKKGIRPERPCAVASVAAQVRRNWRKSPRSGAVAMVFQRIPRRSSSVPSRRPLTRPL